METQIKRPYKARAKPVQMSGYVVLLQHNGQCKALGAGAPVINALSPELQKTLPSLCGVWNTFGEVEDALKGVPEELKPYLRIQPVMVTLMGTR